MIDKKDIVNSILLISFPIYGIGNYVSGSSPSAGVVISFIPYLSVILFYLIDLLYRKRFTSSVNSNFYIMSFFLAYTAASIFVSQYRGLPDSDFRFNILQAMSIITPFLAFVIGYLYNMGEPRKMIQIVFNGFGLLIIANLLGHYGLGLSNKIHTIEDRISLPFFSGFYEAGDLLAILNLMIVYRLVSEWRGRSKEMVTTRNILIFMFFLFNSFLIFQINSRLTILVFMLVLGLFLFKILKKKAVYWTSWLMLPALLNFSILLYQILSLPLFSAIMQRIDFEDITSFNGRAFLWERGINWILEDQRGLFFGNGDHGHYFLGLFTSIAKLWSLESVQVLHFHSTVLELLVDQGLVGFGVFAFLLYRIFNYYRQRFIEGSTEGVYFIAIPFMLFSLQINIFFFPGQLGFMFISIWAANISFTNVNKDHPNLKIERKMELEVTD